jgi:carbamoyl-phosphate synthase large subunit
VAARRIGYAGDDPPLLRAGRARHDGRLRRSGPRPLRQAAFMASPGFPVLIDRFLERATRSTWTCSATATDVYIGGVMQHIEVAGIHSGDSACVTPPHTLPKQYHRPDQGRLPQDGPALKVKGLLNVQMAVFQGERDLRDRDQPARLPHGALPGKATGVPLAKLAAKISRGQNDPGSRPDQGQPPRAVVRGQGGGAPLQPVPGVDPMLGPEMKSTGEVMGIDMSFELAYWKSQIAAGQNLPKNGGTVFLSARDVRQNWMVEIGKKLASNGFQDRRHRRHRRTRCRPASDRPRPCTSWPRQSPTCST